MSIIANILTPRQKQVLDYIKEYAGHHGYSPTYEEIGVAVKLSSTATIYNHVKALIKKGYIKKQQNVTRGLVVIADEKESDESTHTIQVLGKITGTTPLVEGGASLRAIDIPTSSLSDVNFETCYALEVWGHQLISEGLISGDIIIFQYTESVEDGKIYLVVVENGSSTIKKVYKQDNSASQNVQIHGRALMVIRRY